MPPPFFFRRAVAMPRRCQRYDMIAFYAFSVAAFRYDMPRYSFCHMSPLFFALF